jgi:UDP-galactopyranose mutase
MKQHIGIAGAGFAGSVIARELAETGKYRVTIYDERNHVGGNCHTFRDEKTGIMVHQYGPHIFNTNREDLWLYINRWGKFESFVNRVMAHTKRGIFSLPINLLTINQFFEKKLIPTEARDFIGRLSEETKHAPQSFEKLAKNIWGKEFYENFFYGYTKKWWGTEPHELCESILKEASVRFNYNDNYYSQKYQGIPVSGYTEIIKRILDHNDIEIRTGQKLLPERKKDFDHLFWSGPIDAYFNYQFGHLEYRTLSYEEHYDDGDFQGNAIINYCEEEVPFTRIIEYKHLTPWEQHEKTIYYKEYSKFCDKGDIPNYPLNLTRNQKMIDKYVKLAEDEEAITFIGQLGTYRYLDMQSVIGESLELAKSCLKLELKSWKKFSHRSLS